MPSFLCHAKKKKETHIGRQSRCPCRGQSIPSSSSPKPENIRFMHNMCLEFNGSCWLAYNSQKRPMQATIRVPQNHTNLYEDDSVTSLEKWANVNFFPPPHSFNILLAFFQIHDAVLFECVRVRGRQVQSWAEHYGPYDSRPQGPTLLVGAGQV